MIRIAYGIRRIYRRLVCSVVESAEDAEPKLFVLGILCVLGFPLYYVIWTLVFPQPYENLGLRVAGMCVAAPALLYRRWPRALHRYVAAYWYLAILLCAPFFFAFMLLQNQVNTVWSTSFLAAITLVVLVFDLANAALIIVLGSALAFVAHAVFVTQPIPWIRFFEQVPIYIFAVIAVTLFNQAIARETRAKIAAAMALGGHIAHELRTPLVSMRAAAELVDELLPGLLDRGQNCAAIHERTAIRAQDKALLLDAPSTIIREVNHAFMVIDLALINTGIRPYDAHELRTLPILTAVASAIRRYPFKNLPQKDWVEIDYGTCFDVRVIPILFDHVIFNVVKNAVYAIQAAGRTEAGSIRIRAECSTHGNRLYIKDNGTGIPLAAMKKIFNPFFSTRANGTGLGLHFCRTVMTRFGGDIACRSELGQNTEIILLFPGEHSPKPQYDSA